MLKQIPPFVGIGIGILLLPVALLSDPRLLPALALVPIWFGVERWRTGTSIPLTALNWPLYLLLATSLVSLIVTPDILFSLEKVVGLIFSIALFWIWTRFSRQSQMHFWIGVALFLGLSIGIVGIGFLKTDFSIKFPSLAPIIQRLSQVQSLFDWIPLPAINANQLAGVLTWLLPFTIALAIAFFLPQTRGECREAPLQAIWPSLLGLTTLVFLFAFLLTQSRTAWLAVVCAFLFMGWAAGGWLRRIATGAALMGGLGLILAMRSARSRGFLLELLGLNQDAIFVGNAVGGLNGRIEIWSRALLGIEDFLITGMGMNTFREAVHTLYPLFSIPRSFDIGHAHNHLLQVTLDLGLFGLIAYLAIWTIVVWLLVISWRICDSVLNRVIVIGFSGSLLAYWLYGLTDTVSLGAKPGFLWWLLIALITAWADLQSEADSNVTPL